MDYHNPFDNQDVTSYTVKTFGDSVRQRRKQLDISLRKMARKIGMTPVYLSEIERGNRPAPTGIVSGIDYMSILAKELYLTDSQKKTYKIMAQVSHMRKIKLMDNYFINNPSALKFAMRAMEENWTNEQWEKLYDSIGSN